MILQYENADAGMRALMDRVAAEAMRLEGVENAYACVTLTDDEEIRRVNREMRGIDRSTDVLSFPSIDFHGKTARSCPKRIRREYDPSAGKCCLGDIMISLETAERQAREFGHSRERELGYLVAHSMFHLMGYDHMTEEDKAKMRPMEEKCMRNTALARPEDTVMTDEELFDLAVEALEKSYSPYSNFRVGACLLADDGRVFQGANVENASYGATICAERCALMRAVYEGAKRFTAIAVVGTDQPAWPCGICRQALNEFAAPDMRVICGYPGGGFRVLPLKTLLPESFGPNDLLEEKQ